MENLEIKRLDHLGIISGLIKELKIIEKIDQKIEQDPKEKITTGEAVAGMIMNGLGFTESPLYLTPQFFEERPLELLFRKGVTSENFNRFKLGRSLDEVFEYGCDLLFNEIAMDVCKHENINTKIRCVDTTSFSLSGEYNESNEPEAITITHGYSKDHRNDLKQAVLELVVCKEGGVPIVSKSFSGNESDNKIFKERCKKLIEEISAGDNGYIIADSKLYSKKNAENLNKMAFVTRVPASIKKVGEITNEAIESNDWIVLDETYKFKKISLNHYSIDQRWIIVFSNEAFKQTEYTLEKAKNKEQEKFSKAMYHLKAKKFDSEVEAINALEKITKGLLYHNPGEHILDSQTKYLKRGKPRADTPKKTLWKISTTILPDEEKILLQRKLKSCYVLATNISSSELPDAELLKEYKKQSTVERGFRFLKDPIFFASSLFLKKPQRIQGLLMVMTLSLLIYSIAERRLRNTLKIQNDTLPNQIGQKTKTPTLRWCFQILQGINFVSFDLQNQRQSILQGITDIRKKILSLFGSLVANLYDI